MLQINVIREKPDWVKERLAVKNFAQGELIDELLVWDEKRKKYQFEWDELQAKINSASKEIGQLMSRGEKEKAEERKQDVFKWKSLQDSNKLEEAGKKIEEILYLIPNLPDQRVPLGKTPDDNEIVREGGKVPQLTSDAMPHWDLAKKYDLIDFELGNKITGSGFPVYRKQGAALQRALISYFLEYNISAGYTEYYPPFLVNATSAFGTGQLPDKEGQMYHVNIENYYLIPTAEVPVTNIYRDMILKEDDLPVKLTAYTPCFRREAGSYGKDVRGLNRVHQFDKVEIVQLAHPAKSYDVLEEMVSHVERLIQSLGLPYRVLKLCGGDMSFASALTYDFEVYSAGQQKWLEVSSVSNFETFQTNRMKTRYKDESGKSQLLHSLNGSSLALPRIFASLIENNQTGKGIALPAVLEKYFGNTLIS